MKFFVPFVTDEVQLNRLYQRITQNLIKMGYEPLRDRVYQVDYELDGKLISEAVGRVSYTNNEIVMAIFKNDRGYLICTYSRGVASGQPIIAHYKNLKLVVPFTEGDGDEPFVRSS